MILSDFQGGVIQRKKHRMCSTLCTRDIWYRKLLTSVLSGAKLINMITVRRRHAMANFFKRKFELQHFFFKKAFKRNSMYITGYIV
jgi:hypothetical protein